MSAWTLMILIFVPCLTFTDHQVTGFFFFCLMLIIFHVLNPFFLLCRGKNCIVSEDVESEGKLCAN